MKLTIVGCAGSFPNARSACSGYLVEADGFRLLLDMGNGSLGPLQQHIGLHDLDAIVVSHLHGDHCLDASTYAVARRFDPQGPLPRLPLYGPEGTLRRLNAAYSPHGAEGGLTDVYEEHLLTAGRIEIGPFEVDLQRVRHPVETYAVRLSHQGSSLTYSADTGPCAALVELAHETDTLLCEASFNSGQANPVDLHLTGAEAGDHGARAGAGRLLLTHLTAWTEPDRTLAEASAAFDGETILVAAGESYDI